MQKRKSKERISQSIEAGVLNRLKVSRRSENGIYLASQDATEVLLPNRYLPQRVEEGEIMELFVYHDSEDRLVATTLRPSAMLGEFGLFEVVAVESYGAFVDWNLPKDLFVPLSQQKSHFRVGDKKVLVVALDARSGRVYASERLGKFYEKSMKGLGPGMKLEYMVIARTPMGWKVVADNRYEGMLYDNELFEEMSVGKRGYAYIRKVRKDRKLDLTLNPPSADEKIAEDAGRIRAYLEAAHEPLYGGYKLSPEDIAKHFHISRKAYKRALTKLLEDSEIELREDDKGVYPALLKER
jgi:predicted RNA-binding protein (virulence factor B family)